MTKRFGALHRARRRVAARCAPGTFHALLGENGAGKSTLVKCIMGYYRADAGQILVDGRERAIDNPRDAHALGIGMVYQHFTLVPSMTVAENLVLARDDVPAVIDWRRARARSRRSWRRMPFSVALDAPVRHARRRREAEARDPEAALPRQPLRDPRRADLGADAATRPTRCWACCAPWPRRAS